MKVLQNIKRKALPTVLLTLAAAMYCGMTVFAAGIWTPSENTLYAVKNQPFCITVSYEGAASYTCETAELPKGIIFDAQKGTLSGTPEEPGDSMVTIKAYEADGNVAATMEYIFRVGEMQWYHFSPGVNDVTMGQIGVPDSRWQEGTTFTAEVKANDGYVIASIMRNGNKVENLQKESVIYAADIIMNEDQALYAEFVPRQQSVSDNSVPTVSDNSVPAAEEKAAEAVDEQKEIILEEKNTGAVSPMQTVNYKQSVLADWQQISQALGTLTPEAVTNPDTEAKVLMLQLKEVKNIPAEVKDSIAVKDDSGYTKALQCNLGCGVAVVLNGNQDNSGFTGISNANVNMISEKRGKKSIATTVRFEAHQNLGTVAGLQVNLPQCGKGTKVSVYAETVTVDAQGNTVVGENVCIGNTKANENGNVEVPIQATANYMFVYKAAKE